MEITKEKVATKHDVKPKRMNFGYGKQKSSIRPQKYINPEYHSVIYLPFRNTIEKLFPWKLFNNKKSTFSQDSLFRLIQTEEETNQINKWCDECSDLVFLNDCMDVSFALSFNFADRPGNYTSIGQLERDAKQEQDAESIQEIINHLTKRIQFFEILKRADFVCGVPKHQGKGFHLPEELARGVATSLHKTDITPHLEFDKSKPSLKDLPYQRKWDVLENSGITFSSNIPNLKNSKIILIDDKYQSGVTIQFVASKLQEQGAKEVYGLCAVKTWRDDDNQT